MSDNIAVLDGFTEEVELSGGPYDLFLLVRPGTDLGDRFLAWDTDAQEYIYVNGWLFA